MRWTPKLIQPSKLSRMHRLDTMVRKYEPFPKVLIYLTSPNEKCPVSLACFDAPFSPTNTR